MKTTLKKYTAAERLGKMEVDLIDITVSVDPNNTGGDAEGDLFFKVTEIPNAVSVDGGSAILQSCCAIIAGGDNDGADVDAFDVVVTADSTQLLEASDSSEAESGDAMSGMENALGTMDGTCGYFSVVNGFDAGVVAIANTNNIGMVCKAEQGSKSLYVYGVVQNDADYNQGSMVLRLGFIKD